EDQWVHVGIVDTASGGRVGSISSVFQGDAEVDPTRRYYYRCEQGISDAHLTKYDVSTDSPIELATGPERGYGSRTLVLSGDGSRLFWCACLYDTDLHEQRCMGSLIYATTLHGDLAVG